MNWVFLISLFTALLNIADVLVVAFKSHPGLVSLWVGHYYPDYFAYVQVVSQGIRGRLLIENPYATNDYSQTFLAYFPDLLLGRIGGILRLPPIATYWLGVAIFSFILSVLIFLVLRSILSSEPFYFQICTFLLVLFSSSFYRLYEGKIAPFDAWYFPDNFFRRFGGVTRHLLDQIIALLVILLLLSILEKIKNLSFQKIFRQGLGLGLLLGFLVTFSYLSLNLAGAIFLLGIYLLYRPILNQKGKSIRKYLALFLPIFLLIFASGLLVKYFSPHFGALVRAREWDVAQQIRFSPLFFLKLLGPIVLLAPLGFFDFFSRLTPIKILIFSLFAVSLVFFLLPVAPVLETTNMRFLTPLMYLFLGSSAGLGLRRLVTFKGRFKKGLFILGTILLLVAFLPANLFFFKQNLAEVSLNLYPEGFFPALSFLDLQPGQAAVLTGPKSDLGVVLPIFADKKVYLGRHFFTPDFEAKKVLAGRFYSGEMNNVEGKDFLLKNKIFFVLWTSWDGDINPLFKYDFLIPVFKNDAAIVFKMKQE